MNAWKLFLVVISFSIALVVMAPWQASASHQEAVSAPTSSQDVENFESLPEKIREAVKSSQGLVSVVVQKWVGMEMGLGFGLLVDERLVLIQAALIPPYPDLAYGSNTVYFFNDVTARFVYGSLELGLALLELDTPVVGMKAVEFADRVYLDKKYEKVGIAYWDEDGKVAGVIVDDVKDIELDPGIIKHFLDGFMAWNERRPREGQTGTKSSARRGGTPRDLFPGLSQDEANVVNEQSEVFGRILYYYATQSLVKPDNLLACAQEMLRMKPNEKSCRDRYSSVTPKEEYEQDFVPEMKGKFGGVGLEVSQQDGKVVVVSPIEGTPAYRAGIKPGDVILKVDGVPVTNLRDAVKRIRGRIGVRVEITVERNGREVSFTVVRETVTIRVVSSKVIDVPSGKIGYIKVKKFNDVLPDQFRKEMRDFRDKGVNRNRVVLDLRYNPGGLLLDSLEILYEFAKPGDILLVQRERSDSTVYDTAYTKKVLQDYKKYLAQEAAREGREFIDTFGDREPGEFRDMKVVILVNKGSASASEIFAGTMKDWGYPVVGPPCGQPGDEDKADKPCGTFGKGVGQTVLPLPDGSTLHLTTFEFLVGNSKTKVDGIGVIPTYEVPDRAPSSAEILREDRQLQKAIEILSGQ